MASGRQRYKQPAPPNTVNTTSSPCSPVFHCDVVYVLLPLGCCDDAPLLPAASADSIYAFYWLAAEKRQRRSYRRNVPDYFGTSMRLSRSPKSHSETTTTRRHIGVVMCPFVIQHSHICTRALTEWQVVKGLKLGCSEWIRNDLDLDVDLQNLKTFFVSFHWHGEYL